MKRLILILLLLPLAAAASAAGQRAAKPLTIDAVRSKAAPIDVLRDDVEELKGRMEAQDTEIRNLRTQVRSLEAKVAEAQSSAASQHASNDARTDLQ